MAYEGLNGGLVSVSWKGAKEKDRVTVEVRRLLAGLPARALADRRSGAIEPGAVDAVGRRVGGRRCYPLPGIAALNARTSRPTCYLLAASDDSLSPQFLSP